MSVCVTCGGIFVVVCAQLASNVPDKWCQRVTGSEFRSVLWAVVAVLCSLMESTSSCLTGNCENVLLRASAKFSNKELMSVRNYQAQGWFTCLECEKKKLGKLNAS